MAKRMTNYEAMRQLSPRDMANAIANLSDEMCVCCPRERERRCNEDCAAGLLEWLMSLCSLNDLVWKARKKRK